MSYTKEFVDLNKSIHDRDSFDCGEPELNAFIRTQAAKHMEAGISKTIVLPASISLPNGKTPICAFYTVAPSSINRADLPTAVAKKLPHYPVPVFLLAQLAVHNQYKGQGLGKVTLIKALEYLYKVSAHIPAYAVIVDCLNESAEEFYRQYEFKELCRHNSRSRMFLSMKTIKRLLEN